MKEEIIIIPGGGSGGGSSTGGGGGAIVSGKVSKVFGEVTAGKSVSMKVSNKDLAVKQIVITISNPVKTFTIGVEKLDSKPGTITKDVSGKVYKYMEITKTGITNNDLSSAVVQFDVKQEWLTNNSLTTSDVKLFRWTGQWDELPTTFKEKVNSSARFEATTPGFSTFAVGSASVQPATPTTTPQTSDAVVPDTTQPASEVTEQASVESAPENNVNDGNLNNGESAVAQDNTEKRSGMSPNTIILIVGLVIVAMIVAAIMAHKKKAQL